MTTKKRKQPTPAQLAALAKGRRNLAMKRGKVEHAEPSPKRRTPPAPPPQPEPEEEEDDEDDELEQDEETWDDDEEQEVAQPRPNRKPKKGDLLSEDEIVELGALDAESARLNASYAATLERKAMGETKVRWDATGPALYNGAAEIWIPRVGDKAKVYIDQIRPEQQHKDVVDLPMFPDYADLLAYIKQRFWNGQKCVIKWTIFKNGHQQVATDKIEFGYDPLIAERFRTRRIDHQIAEQGDKIGLPQPKPHEEATMQPPYFQGQQFQQPQQPHQQQPQQQQPTQTQGQFGAPNQGAYPNQPGYQAPYPQFGQQYPQQQPAQGYYPPNQSPQQPQPVGFQPGPTGNGYPTPQQQQVQHPPAQPTTELQEEKLAASPAPVRRQVREDPEDEEFRPPVRRRRPVPPPLSAVHSNQFAPNSFEDEEFDDSDDEEDDPALSMMRTQIGSLNSRMELILNHLQRDQQPDGRDERDERSRNNQHHAPPAHLDQYGRPVPQQAQFDQYGRQVAEHGGVQPQFDQYGRPIFPKPMDMTQTNPYMPPPWWIYPPPQATQAKERETASTEDLRVLQQLARDMAMLQGQVQGMYTAMRRNRQLSNAVPADTQQPMGSVAGAPHFTNNPVRHAPMPPQTNQPLPNQEPVRPAPISASASTPQETFEGQLNKIIGTVQFLQNAVTKMGWIQPSQQQPQPATPMPAQAPPRAAQPPSAAASPQPTAAQPTSGGLLGGMNLDAPTAGAPAQPPQQSQVVAHVPGQPPEPQSQEQAKPPVKLFEAGPWRVAMGQDGKPLDLLSQAAFNLDNLQNIVGEGMQRYREAQQQGADQRVLIAMREDMAAMIRHIEGLNTEISDLRRLQREPQEPVWVPPYQPMPNPMPPPHHQQVDPYSPAVYPPHPQAQAWDSPGPHNAHMQVPQPQPGFVANPYEQAPPSVAEPTPQPVPVQPVAPEQAPIDATCGYEGEVIDDCEIVDDQQSGLLSSI